MSPASSRSYLKVAYDLRPAKQVERRMLLDFFRRLAGRGIPVESFRYTGMGSIHFVDHILFHKFLGIDRLVSVERDAEIRDRVQFNRPFDSVELVMAEIGHYIPKLDRDEKHIVWLDYDYPLSEDMLADVRTGAFELSEGSFLLVTVDVEPLDLKSPAERNSDSSRSGLNYEHYRDIADDLWKPEWTKRDFTNRQVHLRVLDILGLALQEGVAGRRGLSVLPCFKFVYADGNEMATLGVRIDAEDKGAELEQMRGEGADYLVLDFAADPFYINVPVLTRRERLHLEAAMPSSDPKARENCGISETNFREFARVYRFLPSYAELMIG